MWFNCRLIVLILCLGGQIAAIDFNPGKQDTKKLGPCQTCKALVQSFSKGLERTAREKHGGGDADWEETRLSSYATSEVRLVEIQEGLCNDVKSGKDQCHHLASEQEHLIEDWWFKHQKQNSDLNEWLCISELKLCCPADHYGPECKPCPGNADNPCSGHGKCKGSGTRKGNGECVCHKGYKGVLCEQCDKNYYLSENSLCSPCHQSCLGDCTKDGKAGCMACKPGWTMNPEFGCVDNNECLETETPCKENEFCVNHDGSYECVECDKSCKSCFGDGPDSCSECAAGFKKENDICTDDKVGRFEDQLTKTRYFTYAGLTVATCIILQKNTYIASVVGLTVAIYAALSEYSLHHND